jgi:spermidine synthase
VLSLHAVERTGKSLAAVFASIGFTAVVAQILLMREMIVVFYGNEISLGLMLAGWLLWTAFGSAVLGRFTPWRNPRLAVAVLEALVAIAFPLSLLAARSSRLVFSTVPGEALGPGPMLIASFASLGLFCALSGWLFASAGRLLAAESGAPAGEATSWVYLAEACGAALGGLAASLLLAPRLSPFETAALLAGLNLLAAAVLLQSRRAAVAIVAAALLWACAPAIERASTAWLWRGFRILETRNSPYGNLVVTGTPGGRSLYENGLSVANVPDPAGAEEAVHYALLEHPAPRSLLMIGGGLNGSIAQALAHPSIDRLDYVELDPAIIELARRHFPLPADARLAMHQTDGRVFLKRTTLRFDVILVNLPDPQTAQLNRFYTVEFFGEAAARLQPGGVFSFALHSSENYISPQLGDFLRSIHRTLRTSFAYVTVMPGDPVHFFASNRPGVLVSTSEALLARLRQRHLQATYVGEYFLPFRLTADRVRDLERQIAVRLDTPVNRDLAPIAYYFDTALWSGQFASGSRKWFEALAGVPFWELCVAVLALTAAAALRLRTAALAAGAMGFTMLGAEVLLLLAFQAIHGYIYQQLAIVIAGFMAGMALGSWRALRSLGGWRALAYVQALAGVAPLALYFLFLALARAANDPLSGIAFPLLAFGCGALGGFQFPVASRLYFGESDKNPGALYGADLVGSSIAALALSAWVIPVYGFLRTAVLLALVNAIPAVLAGRRRPAR